MPIWPPARPEPAGWAGIRFTVALLIPPLFALVLGFAYRHLYSAIADTALLDETRRADAAVVFGAAIAAEGRPGRILESRIRRAHALYRDGFVPRLILTGGIGWGPPAESVVMRNRLIALGVPENRLFLETRSTSSAEQVAFAAAVMRRQGFQSALLVSDPWHMYRLKTFFRAEGLTVWAAPADDVRFTSGEQHAYILSEMLKLVAGLVPE